MMKTRAMNKVVLLLAALLAFNLQAGVKPEHLNAAVSVKWLNPDKFSDVRASNGIDRRYQQRVLDSLERYLHKELPKVIAAGQKVEITVFNLDLAGDVRPMVIDHRDVRIVKSIYPPMIDIEYKLIANDGSVVKTSRRKFRDMGFEMATQVLRGSDNLGYEKAMLRKWIRKEIQS